MQTKRCRLCGHDRDLNDFKTKKKIWCRFCHRAYSIKRRTDRKLAAVAYFGSKCMNPNCPIPKDVAIDPCCLDFHHRVPDDKDHGISELMVGKWSEILSELRKCDLLCCLCHRMHHKGDGIRQVFAEAGISESVFGHVRSTERPETGLALNCQFQPSADILEIDGIVRSAIEWCRIYDRNYRTYRTRVMRGWNKIEAIKKPKEFILVNGEITTKTEACHCAGIHLKTLRERRQAGLTLEEALSLPKQFGKKLVGQQKERVSLQMATIDGATKSVVSWLKEYGTPERTYRSRRHRGWPIEKAIIEPVDLRQSRKRATLPAL